ncbi:hypothetical protein Godav_008153 [Gossypium davidsonii]|uniref:Uncharacterized protein n=1 Tax=Gossypium davidsonii TaxID=34287 RepID=A0A7J8S933_GOSDV|nr:hypothetical protein [Gossypium davidsonii]
MGLSVLQYFREYFHGGWRSAHLTGLGSYIVFFVNTRSCFGSKAFSYVESKSWLEVETQRGKPSWQMNAAMLC